MTAGIGIDITDVREFRERLSEELIQELFLQEEISYCMSQVRYWENFAARFAAKEAAFKALGHGLSSGLRFLDVEVVKMSEKGAVSLKLHGAALEVMREKGITRMLVSLSHTRLSAIAVVIAEASGTV